MFDFSLDEALRYLGTGGRAAPEGLMADLRAVADLVRRTAQPRTVWREMPVSALDFPGITVASLLSGCSRCVLFAATLGAAFDALLLRLQKSDISAAVMADACGSAGIEAVCDTLCETLRVRYASSDLFPTARISPGYGDFPLELQGRFCAMLNTGRRIGLSVSTGGLLTPMKSVTALLGLTDMPQAPRPRYCADCASRENCKYRKDGGSCDRL